jgi:hypothetical protein
MNPTTVAQVLKYFKEGLKAARDTTRSIFFRYAIPSTVTMRPKYPETLGPA